MLKRVQKTLLSENGMKAVNVLFFVSIFFRFPPLTIAAHTAWLLFLLYAVRRTTSRGLRVLYGILCVYAAAMAGLNGYYLLAGT